MPSGQHATSPFAALAFRGRDDEVGQVLSRLTVAVSPVASALAPVRWRPRIGPRHLSGAFSPRGQVGGSPPAPWPCPRSALDVVTDRCRKLGTGQKLFCCHGCCR